MTGFASLPLPARLAIVLLLATLAARFINWAIYNWAYFGKSLGPWSPAVGKKGFRVWQDHLPVVGWYRLRRESAVHGKGYWIRPLFIELLFPLAVAWYYHFYVSGETLQIGPAVRVLVPELHWQFVAHFVLFVLMGIATFIDFDEQSIPDFVTIPGTAIGLIGAAFAPAWLPFHVFRNGIQELHAGVPDGWPIWFNGTGGLAIGLVILAIWGFGLLDRRIITRRGYGKAIQYFFAIMFRRRGLWLTVLSVTALLSAFVLGCWWAELERWPYLLSSLMGLAFAGGVTWGVRISASVGLGVEALGFGDVTLMAMIGAFVGWQPSLLIFFLAPIVAIVFVLIRWAVTGDAATPYGPYLCAATVLLLVYWDSLWTGWAAPVFALGNVILGIVVACVVLMGGMLWIWRLIKQALGLAGR